MLKNLCILILLCFPALAAAQINDGQLNTLDNRYINEYGDTTIINIRNFILLNQTLSTLKDTHIEGKITKAPAIEMDSKDFGIVAQILHDINIHKLRLISNSQQTKRVGIIGYGLEIIEYVNY